MQKKEISMVTDCHGEPRIPDLERPCASKSVRCPLNTRLWRTVQSPNQRRKRTLLLAPSHPQEIGHPLGMIRQLLPLSDELENQSRSNYSQVLRWRTWQLKILTSKNTRAKIHETFPGLVLRILPKCSPIPSDVTRLMRQPSSADAFCWYFTWAARSWSAHPICTWSFRCAARVCKPPRNQQLRTWTKEQKLYQR